MAAFTTQVLDTQTGAPPTFTASAASDDVECPDGPNQVFLVFKGGAGSNNIAITMAKQTSYGETYPAPGSGSPSIYTLGAAATTLLFIPLYPEYNNGSGRVTVTNSASSGVTMAVVRA